MNVDPQDARPLYLQIIDEVHRAIVTGSLQPGDALPSVRELAAILTVNPRTVRQAYGELELEGIVYVRRGLGTFVAAEALPDDAARRVLARDVARRALLDARRNGLDTAELIATIGELANEEQPASAGHDVEKRGVSG